MIKERIQVYTDEETKRRVELAKRFNRPRAYDTVCLAHARLDDCESWTADEKLYHAVKDVASTASLPAEAYEISRTVES